MKQYLKKLLTHPSNGTLTQARSEEQRVSDEISNTIYRLTHDKTLWEHERERLSLSLDWNEEYLEEARRVKEEIAYILTKK